MISLLQRYLLPEHIQAGLYLEEDDHILYLKHGDKVIAYFSAQGAIIKEVQKEAHQYLCQQALKVEFLTEAEAILREAK